MTHMSPPSNHLTPPHPSSLTNTQWNKYTPSLIPNALATVPTPILYSTTFTTHNILHPSDWITNYQVSYTLTVFNNTTITLLQYYNSPFIIATDGFYHAPLTGDTFPPPPSHITTTGRATTSTVVLAIIKITKDDT